MSKLHTELSARWGSIQVSLFPWLEEELGAITLKEKQLVAILELIRIEDHVKNHFGWPGRPPAERTAIARSFVAKMVYNEPTTKMFRDRLLRDKSLRRLCGWEFSYQVPSESTFSRAYAEFAANCLPERVHESLITKSYQDEIIGHISRDSTAIEAREKPVAKPKKVKAAPKKRGRPKKGEKRPKPPKEKTRIEKQIAGMGIEEMLQDLPSQCDVGTKRNSKGHSSSWIGYKLHIDAADGGVPISCVLSSASVHDSQVAIPLAEITNKRVDNLYDLMDAAYDSPLIRKHSQVLGHVPIIDVNPRANKELRREIKAEQKARRIINHKPASAVRYQERSTVERVNSRLKDSFGARFVRVRGASKVMCHLMFGVLALTAEQLMRMVQ